MMFLDIILKKEFFMYRRLLIFTFCILGLTMLLSALPIHGESEIYSSVVRLHVLANSDSDEDQELKLKVRDAILDECSSLFADCKDQMQAKEKITQNLALIESVAQKSVRENGFSYGVGVMLGNEEYPTKNYESCCFPAGEYLSLRVMIGEAEGQNWWCVLFPPMCLSAASQSSEAAAEVGLSGEQYNIITESESPKYKLRFKLLEAFGGLFGN